MASGSDGISPPPNPTTPLAFLPPDLAYQLTITTYLFVGATAVSDKHIASTCRRSAIAFRLLTLFSTS